MPYVSFGNDDQLHLMIDIVNEDGKEFAPMTQHQKKSVLKGNFAMEKGKELTMV